MAYRPKLPGIIHARVQTMKPHRQPIDWRAGRRLRAGELHQQGWKHTDSATAVGITPGAVSPWMARGRAGGVTAVRTRTSPGAPVRLPATQPAGRPAVLPKGAAAGGFRGAIWTRARVAAVITRAFGVAEHPDHTGRLRRAIGGSGQQPSARAPPRNEPALADWRAPRRPAPNKKPPPKGAPGAG